MKCFRTALALTVAAMALGIGNASAAEKPKLAMILKTLSAPYWQIVVAGAKEAAEKNGADLVVLGPPTESAVEQQINMVQDVLAQKPDALIFSPSQPPTAVGVLSKFAKAKIPVILVDTGMPEGFTDYVTFIGTDNFAAGKAGGEALAKVMKKGEKVLLLDGAPGNPAMTDRVNGAKEVLDAAGIVVGARQPADSDRERAFSVTQNVLQSTPDISGVFAGNDDEALGAMRALKQSGKDVPVIGVNADDDALHAILSGDLYGSVAQSNYQMGVLGVEKALAAIKGEKIDKRIDSGAEFITKDNAQALLDQRAKLTK